MLHNAKKAVWNLSPFKLGSLVNLMGLPLMHLIKPPQVRTPFQNKNHHFYEEHNRFQHFYNKTQYLTYNTNYYLISRPAKSKECGP